MSGLLFPLSLQPAGDHFSTRSAARKGNPDRAIRESRYTGSDRGYARDITSLQLPHNRAEHLTFLKRLVELWDKTEGNTWEFPRDRDQLNAPLIYGFAAQAATLSKAVLTLYAAGQDFAALPLMRTTMECAL